MKTRADTDPMIPATRGRQPVARWYAGDAALTDPLVSPLYADLSGLPPMLIHVGDHEVLLSDSTRLAEKAKAAGVDVTLEGLGRDDPRLPVLRAMLPEGQQAIAEIGEWVQAARRGEGGCVSILVGNDTRLLVQGITGKEGSFQTRRCIEYGTNVVAGVTPGRGGETAEGVPVFDTVKEAVAKTDANCALIFVPAPFSADAVLEAAYSEVPVIICITEGVPTLDMVRVRRFLQGSALTLIGPNCPGVITPGEARVGIMPGHVFSPGRVGVISRSGTLVYEAVAQLTARGIGQSTCVGVGGDPVIGTTQVEALRMFNDDPGTDAVDPHRRDRRRWRSSSRRSSSPPRCGSRSSPSSAGRARLPAAAWATPARSSSAQRARRRPRRTRCGPRAPRSSIRPRTSARWRRRCWPRRRRSVPYLNLHDLEPLAQEKLPAPIFDFIAGGAEDEVTLRANRAAFEAIEFRPRVLVDVSKIDTSTTVLGRTLPFPVMLAPVAMHRLVHPEGEAATARAAAAAGTMMILSTMSSVTDRRRGGGGDGPKWFQLYCYGDRGVTERLVKRAEAAGFEALCLTVDVPRLGRRERDFRHAAAVPGGRHPGATSSTSSTSSGVPAGRTGAALSACVASLLDQTLTWETVGWLRSITKMPVLVKGVLTPEDALLAVEHGASGIVVSNHGGRQLDGSPAADHGCCRRSPTRWAAGSS